MKKHVLLLGKGRSYITDQDVFSCKYGSVNLSKAKVGQRVRIGKERFTVCEPSLSDFIFLRAKRGPQVILPRDAGVIAAETGCGVGWKVLEGGSGSGFLSIFLGNIGCKVYGYERNKDFFEKAKANVRNSGAKGVKIVNKSIESAKEKVDLICLDLEDPEKAITRLKKNLRPGGWFAVYSMHIEQASGVFKKLNKLGFSVKMVENIRRDWKSGLSRDGKREMTRPKTHMIGHTGFLIFGRKI